jgi:hypothetical protein
MTQRPGDSFYPKPGDYLFLIGHPLEKIDLAQAAIDFRNNPARSTLIFKTVIEGAFRLGPGNSEIVAVRSSLIHSLAYNDASQSLTVLFRDGRVTKHTGVNRSVFNLMLLARSKGQYYTQNIQGRYATTKLK